MGFERPWEKRPASKVSSCNATAHSRGFCTCHVSCRPIMICCRLQEFTRGLHCFRRVLAEYSTWSERNPDLARVSISNVTLLITLPHSVLFWCGYAHMYHVQSSLESDSLDGCSMH